MTRPMVRIHNTETNEIIDREMNDDEFSQYVKDFESHRILQEHIKETETAKAAAEAKLEALGLTADDLKALGL